MRTSRIAIGLAVTAVLLMASALTAAAQLDELKNTTPEQRAKAQTAYMKGKLDLTPAQLTQVEAMNRKYADRMEPIIKGEGRRLAKMREARTIEEAKEAELKSVLTPDQFQKFLASKEEMRAKVMEGLKSR